MSDQYLKNGSGAGSGKRRNVIALTMLVASSILLIPFTDDIALLVLIFSLTLAGIASTTSLNFSLLNDLLPGSGDVGRAMAFVVVGGNLFGMLAPVITGYVISTTGSYNWAFGIAGERSPCHHDDDQKTDDPSAAAACGPHTDPGGMNVALNRLCGRPSRRLTDAVITAVSALSSARPSGQ